MKSLMIAALLGAAAASAALPASAQVDARQNEQAARINQGVRSGELTPRETRHVERQQGRIARMESEMRARHGGRLTRYDHERLREAQNRASRNIYNKKHNGRVD